MKKFVLASVLSVSLLGGVASAGTITSLPRRPSAAQVSPIMPSS